MDHIFYFIQASAEPMEVTIVDSEDVISSAVVAEAPSSILFGDVMEAISDDEDLPDLPPEAGEADGAGKS